jgi:hypothetical protein
VIAWPFLVFCRDARLKGDYKSAAGTDNPVVRRVHEIAAGDSRNPDRALYRYANVDEQNYTAIWRVLEADRAFLGMGSGPLRRSTTDKRPLSWVEGLLVHGRIPPSAWYKAQMDLAHDAMLGVGESIRDDFWRIDDSGVTKWVNVDAIDIELNADSSNDNSSWLDCWGPDRVLRSNQPPTKGQPPGPTRAPLADENASGAGCMGIFPDSLQRMMMRAAK